MTRELEQRIREHRSTGVVHVGSMARPGGAARGELFRRVFTAAAGTAPRGSAGTEVERAVAVSLLTNVLARDLAYRAPIMDEGPARELATTFLDAFGRDATFWTNGDLGLGSRASWDPVTAATFDTGVFVLGAQRVGVLWVEDED